MKLKNKVVFISDADSDSGKVIIERLLEEGAALILNSSSAGKAIESLTNQCLEKNITNIIVNVNLCNKEEVDDMLKKVIPSFQAIDVFIHNNNVVKPASVEECTEDLFKELMDVNVKSAFICTQSIGKYMVEQNDGRIIYVSSIHAEKPSGSAAVYSMSKGALKMLSKEMALELGRYGINVNVIELGPIEGDNKKFSSDITRLYDHYERKVPRARLGTYGDLAGLVVYLAGDDSSYMNGASVRMDGGFTLHYIDQKMKEV